jgi:hypothetical protein
MRFPGKVEAHPLQISNIQRVETLLNRLTLAYCTVGLHSPVRYAATRCWARRNPWTCGKILFDHVALHRHRCLSFRLVFFARPFVT